MFRRKPTETVRIDENKGDLECEEAIMSDKTRFGRVRTSLMKHLRTKYGKEIANRALWRVNRRRSEGYLNSNIRK
jgi:hypothetical protein